MGIRASYWVTGGILTVLGLAVGKVVLGFLTGVVLTVGAVLVKLTLVALFVGGLWLALRATRRRPEPGA